METMDLTRWLQIVWDELTVQDKVKRDGLLRSADMLLREDSTPEATYLTKPETAPGLMARTRNYLSRSA
jgi:hypothetical protein